jgi:hypothetical protein
LHQFFGGFFTRLAAVGGFKHGLPVAEIDLAENLFIIGFQEAKQ